MKKLFKNIVINALPKVIDNFGAELLPFILNLVTVKIFDRKETKFFNFLMQKKTREIIDEFYKIYTTNYNDYRRLKR